MPPAVARRLGIKLSSRKEAELFKWFLACLLFGKPIQQEIAERAYARLISAGLRNPDAVIRAGWDELVRLLDDRHQTARGVPGIEAALRQHEKNDYGSKNCLGTLCPPAGVQTHRPRHCPDLHQ